MVDGKVHHWKHGWIPIDAATAKKYGKKETAAGPVGKDFRSMTSADKIKAAEIMYGTGSAQHEAAKRKFNHSSESKKAPAGAALAPGLVKDFKGGSAEPHLVKGSDGATHFTAERTALHDKIINDIVGGHASQAHPAFVMLGGGPASGKTKAAEAAEKQFHDPVTINPDDIKAMLPEYGPKGTQGAAFTHEESSYLAKQATAAAIAKRTNIVLDAVGDTSVESVMGKLVGAQKAGYSTHARYVTVPTNVAQERAVSRGKRTGRVVAPTVISHSHQVVSQVFPKVMSQFDTATLYDNTSDFKTVLTSTKNASPTIHDPQAYMDFLRKASGG